MQAYVIDVARPVICASVCLSVGHTGEPCKSAEPIEILFGRKTRMGPRTHDLDGGVQIGATGRIRWNDRVWRRRCGLSLSLM